jgi:hypothetical protein
MSEMNNNNYTPGELISLFIDGELGESERETLFDALAGNPELQAEFERALHINHAVAQEVLKTVPPVALTNAIFAEAGFELVSSGSVASAVSGGSSGFLKMLLIPVLSAVLASALTGVVLYEHFEDKLEEVALKNGALKEKAVAVNSFKKEGASVEDLTQATDDKEGFRTSRNDNAYSLSFPQAQRVGNLSSHTSRARHAGDTPTRTSDDLGRFRASRNDNALGDSFKNVENSFKNNNDVILSESEESTSKEQRQNVLLIEKIQTFKNTQSFLKTEKSEISLVPIPDFNNEEVQEKNNSFSAELRHITSIRLFPKRETQNTSDFLNNKGMSILYHIDNHHFMGIEAGQEDFPIYVEDASGEFQPTSTLQWIGGNYRFTSSELPFLKNIQPFIQMFAGGTRIGPIFKSIGGISWHATENVKFLVGIEGTALRYKYNASWQGAEKISATYNVSISF